MLGVPTVEEFGTDYRAAPLACGEAKRANGLNPRRNTVLIRSDSLATIEQTHSSYFKNAGEGLKQLLKL